MVNWNHAGREPMSDQRDVGYDSLIVGRGTYGQVVTWEADDHHEYDYVRVWDDTLPVLLFVLLNPASGEDQSAKPDVTTRRCVGYAKRAGCGGIRLVNLYTFRATDPADLSTAAEPNGPTADEYLTAAFAASDGRAVVGWGSRPAPEVAERVAVVSRLADEAGCSLFCVRLNRDGSPGHPSRGPYLPLQPWPSVNTSEHPKEQGTPSTAVTPTRR